MHASFGVQLGRIAIFIGLLLIWEAVVRVFEIPMFVVPAPSVGDADTPIPHVSEIDAPSPTTDPALTW